MTGKTFSYITFIILLALVPIAFSFTLTGNVLQDLVAMNGDFKTEANQWTASKLYDGAVLPNICGDTPLLGGPSVLGSSTGQSGEFFSRTYSGLPPHDLINFQFEFWAIDNWQGSTNGDTFQIAFDSTIFDGWTWSSTDTVTPNKCGILNQYEVPAVKIEGNVSHNASSITFKVISKLTQESGLQSFGFRAINFVFSVSGEGSSVKSICARAPTVLPDSRKCSCMSESQYESPVGSGHCIDCDPTCKTCSGSADNQCLSCPSGRFKSGTSCSLCHTTCLTCDGAGTSRCLSCKPGTYLSGTQCPACHTDCATCNGGTSSNCLTCPDGSYKSGTQCPKCHSSCATCNGGSASQCLTCPIGSYLLNGNTCTACSSPLVKSKNGQIPICTSPCSDPNQYLYWNGECLSSCDSPLASSSAGTYKLCTYPCTSPKYLDWNGLCVDQCAPPLEVVTQKTKNFCIYKCTGDDYLYWDGSCISTCPFPLKARTESDNKRYCDYPCTSSQYLLWDQTCASSCASPLKNRTQNGEKFCDFSCDSSQYAYWNNTCSTASCSPPLIQKIVGTSSYERRICDLVCAANEYLHWTGICVTTCDAPLNSLKSNGVLLCNPPCNSARPYYFTDLRTCGVTCVSPRYINSTGLYPICAPAPVADQGGSLLFYITNAPVKPKEYTVVVTTSSLQYIHYLDMPMPERFEKLANSTGKSFLSPRFGFSIPSDFTSRRLLSTFIKYPISAVFERSGLHSSFLINFWDGLLTLAVIAVSAIVLTVIERILRKTELKVIYSIAQRLMVMAACNYLILLFISSIDQIILYSAIEFSTFSYGLFENTAAIVSFAISVLMLLLIFFVVLFTVWLVKHATDMEAYEKNEQNSEAYTNFAIKWRFCQVLIRGFKSDSFLNKLFYPLYILRINIPIIFTAVLYQYPLVLAIIQLVINIAAVVYIILKRPLVKKINLIQLIIIEIISLIMNVFVLVLVIMMVYDLNSNSDAVTSIGDVIIVGSSILEVLRLLFLVIKAKIEIDAIRLILKGAPHKGKVVFVNLLSVLAQQTAMGFEEILDESSIIDTENKYHGILARPFATEKAAQARNKNGFGREIINDSEPMLRKDGFVPGSPDGLLAESQITSSILITNNELQKSNILAQQESPQVKKSVKEIMNDLKFRRAKKTQPLPEEHSPTNSPAFSINISDNSPEFDRTGSPLLKKSTSIEKISPQRRARGQGFFNSEIREGEGKSEHDQKMNLFPVPFAVDGQE